MSNGRKVIPLPVAATKKKPKRTEPPKMRLFVALHPPASVQEAAVAPLQLLSEDLEIRPTPVDNVHLTLAFLGDVDWGRSNAVSKGLRAAAGGVEPFELRCSAAGAFPDLLRPRVLWVGVQPNAQLDKLQDAVATVLETLGFRREIRAFHAHLSIARLKRLPHPGGLVELREVLDAARFPTEPWPVRELILYRSFLEEEGSRYQALAHIPLGREFL